MVFDASLPYLVTFHVDRTESHYAPQRGVVSAIATGNGGALEAADLGGYCRC